MVYQLLNHIRLISFRYNEICTTGFGNPNLLSNNAPHFVQMIWKSTELIGISEAAGVGKDGIQCAYVVARYKPAAVRGEKMVQENVQVGTFDNKIHCGQLQSQGVAGARPPGIVPPNTPAVTVPALGLPAPGLPAPGLPAPGIPALGVAAPGVPTPSVPVPVVPVPGVPSPGVVAPGVPSPGVPTPGTTAPVVGSTGATAPSPAGPGAAVGGGTKPNTGIPTLSQSMHTYPLLFMKPVLDV